MKNSAILLSSVQLPILDFKQSRNSSNKIWNIRPLRVRKIVNLNFRELRRKSVRKRMSRLTRRWPEQGAGAGKRDEGEPGRKLLETGPRPAPWLQNRFLSRKITGFSSLQWHSWASIFFYQTVACLFVWVSFNLYIPTVTSFTVVLLLD